MIYKATLDRTSKLITGLALVLFLVVIYLNIQAIDFETNQWFHYGANIFTLTILTIVYSTCFLLRPIKYIVDREKITIKRPIKDITITRKSIKNVFVTKKDTMKWTIRTFGNGGFFGYYGKFRNENFGNMKWYATKRDNYLILETNDNQKIVLTPDDIGMLNEVQRIMGR
jgi:hypothetical protein